MSTYSMSRIDELQADASIWVLDEHAELELHASLRAANLEADASWERSAAIATLALQRDCSSAPSPWLMESLRASAPAPRLTLMKRLSQPYTILAAALLMLAVVLFWDRALTNDNRTQAPSEMRRELLQANDTAVWQWSGGTAVGDVVWHGGSQRGAMRFQDLAANDPSQRQYQLWIVDSKRNAAQPVDGGVFDVPAGESEVVIPIDPKIVVHDAQAFVVTIEVPGGVVVSNREQIVVLAKPQ